MVVRRLRLVRGIIERVGRFVLWLAVAGCSAAPGSDLVIDRVDPASATNTAAVPLRVEGTGFHLPLTSDLDLGDTVVGAMAVTVGDVPLEAAVWRGEQLIEGSVPAGLAAGTYDVTVTLGDRSGVLPDGYVVLGDVNQTYVLPLVPDDLVTPPGSRLVLLDGAVIDTTAGTISGAAPGSTFELRTDDAAPCAILFVAADEVVVTGTVRVIGARSIAMIGARSVIVETSGLLDARGAQTQGGPGGSNAGVGSMVGAGDGGGGLGTISGTCCDSGAGGGGFSAIGGGGGTSGAAPGGTGGAVWQTTLDRLCGGSGGGGSSGPTFVGCPVRGANGGGGGGGAMLGSYGTIQLDGALNAGGAGGRGSPGCGAGGGGGSGGTIVLAAPTLQVGGVVAANGGGGGGGGDPMVSDPGADGCTCAMPASGGVSRSNGSAGGGGGAGTMLGGVSSLANPNNGGGGGGAAGRVFLVTAPGSPPAIGGTISPARATTAVEESTLVAR